MGRTPEYKVYSRRQYVAACVYLEDAAFVVANYRAGTIRLGHSLVLWREGSEAFGACESVDAVARVCWARADAAARCPSTSRRQLQQAADSVDSADYLP